VNAVRAIAWNTVLEAVREKVLYLLAGFGVFLFVASRLLSPLALGEGRRITCDLGLVSLSLFGVLLIVFVGHSLVHREIERGSVAFLFSRPVGRGAFVAGKYLGLVLVLTAAEAAMGGLLAAVLAVSGYAFGWELAGAVALTIVGLWILAAVAILFASVASPILAGLLVMGMWVIGNGAGSLTELASMLSGGTAGAAAKGILWVVPRLDLYNASMLLVHGTAVGEARWLWSVSYAALYIAGTLLLARAAFLRRPLMGN
jgi:ABC-type transport system involved in multi-copper enzyme maturation permease subunit